MKITLKRLSIGLASAGMLTLYGCGGGGDTTSTSSAAQITGTAATGAALANAPVAITNSAGNSPCAETSITTTALGSYTCTLKSGETAPFFIVVSDPTGQQASLVSIATQTPTAGTPLTVNATPLTTAIIAQLNNGDALGLVANRTFNSANLATVTANVLTQLGPVLTSINAPAGYNPFSTSITAATSANTGNTADQVLDIVRIGTDLSTGLPTLSTITNSTPVPMATTTTGTAIAAPSAGASDLSSAAQIAAQAFTNCFALPTAQRVLAKDTSILSVNGGAEVTGVAPACQNMAANGTNVATSFLHNGYRSGQLFYGILTSDTMTGAKFSVPEIMAFYPAEPTNGQPNDRAVLNIRYIDNAGNPGNVITVAANIAGSSSASRPTNWWLVGNQHSVDVNIKLIIRRIEQLNTGTLPNTATPSRFQSGIQFIVSTDGPNSTGITAAQVTGAGLPTNGLWYFKNAASTQSYMDLSTYRNASTPNASAYTAACTPQSNCPNFWFGKTTSLTATSYGTNSTNLMWAQGSSEGSYNGASGTKPLKGDGYTVKLYAGSNLSYTLRKTLLSDVTDPAQGSKLPWNTTLGTQSLAALAPSNNALNGTQSSLSLDWLQNSAAQQIGSASVTTTNDGSYSNSASVAKGSTSITITPPTPYAFTGLSGTASASNGFRSLLFGYRMLDGSNKNAVFTYN